MIRKTTWITLCIFIILVLAAVYINQQNKNATEEITPTPELNSILSGKNTEDIVRITIKDASGAKIDLKLADNGQWKFNDSTPGELDQNTISERIRTIKDIEEMSPLPNPPSLEDIGLTKPAYTIHLVYKNQDQTTILIGNQTTVNNGYYIKVDNKQPQVVNKYDINPLINILTEPPISGTPTATP
jgi:hypothetical protein